MAEPFYKTYGRELKETASRWAEKIPGAELTKGVGTAIGLITTKKQREETNRQEQETLDTILNELKKSRKRGDEIGVKRWSNIAKKFNVIIPEEEITKEAPTSKQIIASGASLALLAATGYKPYLKTKYVAGWPLKAITKGYQAKKMAQQALKLKKAGIITKALVKVVKPVVKEAAIGSAFFGAIKATEKDAEVNDIIKAAELGALVSGGITASMIGLGAGMGAFQKYVSPKIAMKWGKMVERIEKTARGEVVKPIIKKPLTQVQQTLSYIGEKPITAKQKIAKVAVWGIEQARKFEARIIDKFAAAKRIQRKLERLLGRPLSDDWEKVYRDFRLSDAVAEGRSEIMLTDLAKKLDKYVDVQDDWMAYLTQIDFYDRAKLGQKVPGNQSLDDVVNGLRRIVREAGPNKMKRIGETRKILKDFNVNMLKLRQEAGLISSGEVTAMLKTHPNYIPHDVILKLDDIATQNLAGSMNIAKTDLMGAIGSARNIKNPLEAITARTKIAMRLIERNKVISNLAKIQETHKAIEGMKPLVTAKRVLERRAAFKTLAQTRQELERIKDSLKLTGTVNKSLNTKILQAEKRIEDLFNEGLSKVIKEGDEELFNILSREVDQAISLPMGEQLRGEMTKLDILKYGQVNVTSFNRIKKVINANPQLSNQAKAKLIVDFQKGLANKGKIIVPQNITGTNLAKDLQKVISENRQATVDTLLAKYRAGKLKGIGFGARKTTAFGLNRKILKEKFGISKVGVEVKATEQKLNQLFKTLDDKNVQIKGIVGEIQDLATIKRGVEEQTINFFRDGIKETWVAPTDVVYMIKNLDQPLRGWGWRLMTGPQKIMKKLSTQYNLSFTLPNKLRDEQTAALTARTFIDEMAKRTGVSAKKLNLSATQIKKLYKEAGGFGASIFREGEHLLIKKGLAEKGSYLNPLKIVNTINNRLEQSTRLEVFKKALNRGLSMKDAALVSRNATIDFAKMGTWMRSANQAIPFLNARVQGFINLPKAFVANPEVFARMQMYTAAYPSMLLHSYNTRFESYKNISQYYKNKYWIIMTGEQEVNDPYTGNPTKIPQFLTFVKGEGQQMVANPIQYYLEKSEGIDPRKTKEMIIDTVGSISPLEFQQFASSDWKGTAISQFGPIPTMLAGGWSGKHPYFGTEIVPPSRKEAPVEMQYKKTTPKVIREVADIMNMSPAMLEFYISAWGGVPQDVQRVIDIVYGPEKIKETTLTETKFGIASKFPILRRFMREAPEYYAPTETRKREQKKKIEKEIIGRKLKVSDKAEEIIKQLNRRETKEEKMDYINSLGDELTPVLREKIMSIKKSRESVEALRKNDSVEVRAKYIKMRLDEMKDKGISKEERLEFLKKLREAKILTDKVKETIYKLQNVQ
jgi:hypothetical protein